MTIKSRDGMALALSYLLVAVCVARATIAEKESNILRLSKPQKIAPGSQTDINAAEHGKDGARGRAASIVSKNNPELDWKNYLKMFDGNEEERRDLDVDFMKEKLERTANSIQWLVDLYDPLRWARVPGELRDECKRDMERFLDALRDGELWAAKSESPTD